jgi:hypothetical protein
MENKKYLTVGTFPKFSRKMVERDIIDTSAGGLLVPEGIICSVVSVLALTWFIRYIYY